jgi:hypothetical protein
LPRPTPTSCSEKATLPMTSTVTTIVAATTLSGPQLNFVDGFSCVRDKVPGKVLILFRLA